MFSQRSSKIKVKARRELRILEDVLYRADFLMRRGGEKYIRPKPDDPINKNWITELLLPYDQTIRLKMTIKPNIQQIVNRVTLSKVQYRQVVQYQVKIGLQFDEK